MTVTKEDFLGWANSYRISNGVIDLVMTSDIGPRIMFAGFTGGENHFVIFDEYAGETGDPNWLPYGGHRLWHAPEDMVRTYQPDNSTVPVKILSDHSAIGYGSEAAIGIEKEMQVELSPGEPCAKITHRLKNTGLWAVELSPWALSMMAVGGKAVMPLPPRGTHPKDLLPNCSMTLWAYSRMNDPRWTWAEKYIMLKQEPDAKTPQKMGMTLTEGWAAYVRNDEMFIDYFDYDPNAKYPDQNCNFETFTNNRILEVESLGPLAMLEPGATVELVEHWVFARGVKMPENDKDVDADIVPQVARGKAMVQKM